EGDDPARREADLLARPGVSSLSRPLAPNHEIPEPGDLDRLSFLQDRLQQVEDQLHNIGCLLLVEKDFLVDLVGDICLSHASPLGFIAVGPLGRASSAASSNSEFRYKVREDIRRVK